MILPTLYWEARFRDRDMPSRVVKGQNIPSFIAPHSVKSQLNDRPCRLEIHFRDRELYQYAD